MLVLTSNRNCILETGNGKHHSKFKGLPIQRITYLTQGLVGKRTVGHRTIGHRTVEHRTVGHRTVGHTLLLVGH